jgi:hypothetical protein
MATRYLFRMGLFVSLLLGVTAFGQEPQWTYERRVNFFTGRESDNLVIRGRYLSPLPASHDEGTPTFTVSCSLANLDAIVISTGVLIDNEFGASPKIHAQIDDDRPKVDRAVLALREDSKTLTFRPSNGIGGTNMLFAKKYIVAVESYGKRMVGMEFEMPSNSSGLLRYCGIMKPKQR